MLCQFLCHVRLFVLDSFCAECVGAVCVGAAIVVGVL